MRVLMVAPEPFREPRGTPISIFQRLHGLSELGHEVDLVTYPVGEDVDIPGVRINRTLRPPFIRQVKIGPSLAKLFLDFLLVWKAVVMLSRTRYDVIHSHEEAAFFCAILGALFRVRHVYDMHSSLPHQMMNFGYKRHSPAVMLFGLLEKLTVRSCDAVITIGTDLEKHVESIDSRARRIRIDNMPVQAIGSDTLRGSADTLKARLGLEGRVPVVYTGTFERYQGIDILLDSAAIVSKSCPDVTFVLVGGRTQQVEYWRSEAEKRGLNGSIRFVGSVPLEQTAAYMEMAEILVSPRTGGISVPLKVYSYLLSGKPIVATDIPTHTLVLDNSVAVLTEPSGTGFADGIVQLVRQPDLRRSLGARARRLAEERYSWDDYLKRLSFIYEGLQPVAPVPHDLPERATRSALSGDEGELEAAQTVPNMDKAA